MDIKPVMERIDAAEIDIGGRLSVESAPTLADALEGRSVQFPCAFVVMARERAQPSKTVRDAGSGVPHRQRVTGSLSIVVGVKAAAARKIKLTDDLTDLSDAIKQLVGGWRAPDAETAFDFEAANVLRIANGMAFREVRFTADWFETYNNG